MEINSENKKLIDFLQMINGFLSHPFLRQMKLFNLNEKHLEVSNIPYPDAITVIHKLLQDKYLIKLTEKEAEFAGEEVAKQLEKNSLKEIEDGSYTEEQLSKQVENMFIENGIDIDKIKNDPAESKSAIEIINDNKEIISNHAQEQFIKSPLIGNFFINKDIFILLEMLEKGVNYGDIDHENFPPKLTFDVDTSILYIHNVGPIQISESLKSLNNGHYILEYIFKNGIKETHQYEFMHKDKLFSKPSEEYVQKKEFYERYRSACDYVNNKIKVKYQIEKFLDATTKSVSIINDYV
jgi:hypothetical protein